MINRWFFCLLKIKSKSRVLHDFLVKRRRKNKQKREKNIVKNKWKAWNYPAVNTWPWLDRFNNNVSAMFDTKKKKKKLLCQASRMKDTIFMKKGWKERKQIMISPCMVPLCFSCMMYFLIRYYDSFVSIFFFLFFLIPTFQCHPAPNTSK